MIGIHDNFLAETEFYFLQQYSKQNKFKIHEVGDYKFSILPTPQHLLTFLAIEGFEIIMSFVRNAYEDFDTTLRIHADGIIDGHPTAMASVLYINEPEGVTPNGTCFYKHHKHGYQLSEVSAEEFDRMILEDANDLSKWIKTDTITAKPNRFLLYQANYFHSKFPAHIEQGERQVLVTFYKQLKSNA